MKPGGPGFGDYVKTLCVILVVSAWLAAAARSQTATIDYIIESDLHPRQSTSNAIWAYYAAWDGAGRRLDTAEFNDAIYSDLGQEGRPTPEQVRQLERHRGVVDALLAASRAPVCDWGLPAIVDKGCRVPALGVLRRSAVLLALDARRCGAAREPAAVAERIEAIFRIAHHTAQLRLYFGPLVAQAIGCLGASTTHDLLAQRAVSPSAARLLLRTLTPLLASDDMYDVRPAMAVEMRSDLARFRGAGAAEDCGAALMVELGAPGTIEDAPWLWPLACTLAAASGARVSADVDRAEAFCGATQAAWSGGGTSRLEELALEVSEGQWGLTAVTIEGHLFKPLFGAVRRTRVVVTQLAGELMKVGAEDEVP